MAGMSLRFVLRPAVAGAALALLAGCLFPVGDEDAAPPVACTAEARASVSVTVADAAGAPLGGAVVTWQVDGGPPQPADCVDFEPGPGGCARFVAGWEVPGTIRVAAAKPGFRAAAATVVVEMDAAGCHVVGREVELRLLPA